jgi:hypothetical protein
MFIYTKIGLIFENVYIAEFWTYLSTASAKYKILGA